MRTVKLPFYAKLTFVLASLILIVYVAIIGQSIIVPLVIGFLLSMLLLPLSNFQERKLRIPRIVSSLISPLVFLIFIAALGYFLGSQIAKFKDDWPEFEQQIVKLFHDAQGFVADKFGVDEQEQIDYINKNAEKTLQRGSSFVGTALLSVTSTLASLTFVFLYTFFFLLYRSHLVKFLIWCFGPPNHEKVTQVVGSVQSIVKQYLFGLMIQIAAITIMLYIAFMIIGIKYAFLFALLCGILNLIPYIGIFSASVIASIVTFATGEPIQVLYLLIAIIVVNTIDGNVIMPKIVGSKVQVNSFMALFGIIVAESIWGISGMFLAIPVLAIIKIVFDRVEELRPYGFLLGEEDAPTPLFEKYFRKYLYQQEKSKDELLPKALQTEEQNHGEKEEGKEITEEVKDPENDPEKK